MQFGPKGQSTSITPNGNGCGKSYWHLSDERSRLAPARRSYEGNPFDDWGSFVIALPRGSEVRRGGFV